MGTPEGRNLGMNSMGEPEMNRRYFQRKGDIILAMLDEIYPFDDEMSREDRELVDMDRQVLVMRTGWNNMGPEELEALWLQSHDVLPTSTEE